MRLVAQWPFALSESINSEFNPFWASGLGLRRKGSNRLSGQRRSGFEAESGYVCRGWRLGYEAGASRAERRIAHRGSRFPQDLARTERPVAVMAVELVRVGVGEHFGREP